MISVADRGQTESMATRRSADEVEQVVQEYRASGLSQREFSQQNGIKLSTLGRYIRRDGRSKSPQELVRVKLEAPVEPGSGFVLMLGNVGVSPAGGGSRRQRWPA